MRAPRLRAAGLSLAALVLLAAAGAAALSPVGAPPARLGHGDCRRVFPAPPGGRPLAGIEDIARDDATGRLYLSAYERGFGADPETPPGAGEGVFALMPPDDPAAPWVTGPDLVRASGAPATRPHGIDFRSATLGVIARDQIAGDLHVRLLLIVGGAAREAAALPHDANETALGADGAVYVSIEGGRSIRSNGVVRQVAPRPAILVEGLDFANGLAIDEDGQLWAAESRASRIRTIGGGGRVIGLPGGPDNLTLAPDGRIVAAVHPNLLLYALHRFGLPGGAHAPSRIVAVDPRSGAVETLYDDPDGTEFSGATVGIVTGDTLILGAVHETGLLVCPLS